MTKKSGSFAPKRSIIIIGILFWNGRVVETTFSCFPIALSALKGIALTHKRYPGTIVNIWSR